MLLITIMFAIGAAACAKEQPKANEAARQGAPPKVAECPPCHAEKYKTMYHVVMDFSINFVAVWKIVKQTGNDCAKLEQAVSEHMARGDIDRMTKIMKALDPPMTKEERATLKQKTKRLFTPLGEDISATIEPLKKKCPDKMEKLREKLELALGMHKSQE